MIPEPRLRLIGTDVIAATHAAVGSRGRAMHCFHAPGDAVQRMVNALSPRTYIQPHCHPGAGRAEVCIALTGAATVLCFADSGALAERRIIAPGSALVGVEIPPGVFHTIIALQPQTTIYEVHQGPNDPVTHKRLACWAPAEGTEAGKAWLEAMR